ncbi:MAG: flagellar protein FlgN [Thermodesulfovibrionales bacterium]|nr:flagellar protein FlgN [Thermodesulfovibrionales bacterium]
MSELELIKDILRQQVLGYHALKEILQKERICLTDLRSSEIEGLAKEKDLMVMRLRLLEEERIRLLRRLKEKIKTEKELNLRKLYEITGDEEFLRLRSGLLSLTQAISELNDFNRVLIERTLNYIRGASSLLDSFGVRVERDFSREA